VLRGQSVVGLVNLSPNSELSLLSFLTSVAQKFTAASRGTPGDSVASCYYVPLFSYLYVVMLCCYWKQLNVKLHSSSLIIVIIISLLNVVFKKVKLHRIYDTAYATRSVAYIILIRK